MKFKTIHLGLTFVILASLSACSAAVNGMPEPRPASDKSVAVGRRLIASYGCGSCHFIPGVPGADSRAAPPLNRFYERSYIAGRLPNTADNLIRWLQDPQKINPGNAMPNLGISEDEAHDIVAYLYEYHPLTFGDLINQ